MKHWFLMVSLGWVAHAHSQDVITDDFLDKGLGSRLAIRSVFDPMPPAGYAPVRIVATNGAPTDSVWRFQFSSETQDYRRKQSHVSTLNLPVPAASTQSAVFLVPLVANYSNGSGYGNNGHALNIEFSGGEVRKFSAYDNRVSEFAAVAISKPLADGSLSALEEEVEKLNKAGSRYYGESIFGSRFTAEDLPEDWLGLSGFDFIMLTDLEWQKVSPGVRMALLQWCRFGGALHFYYTGARPASLPPDNPAYGLGEIQSYTWNGSKLPVKETVKRYREENSHFSQLIEGHAKNKKWGLLQALGTRNFNSWQVVAFLVIFGVLVGPVNLFILAPSGQRHRLFVTTPLLSLGASAVMVGLILFQDGIGGKGARVTFIDLEPAEATAYVVQKQFARTGMLLGSSFEVKQPALIEPLALPSSPWVKLDFSDASQPVNLRQEGPLRSGNYFQSRAEQAQMIRASISTRARLELQPGASPEGPPVVVSALGFTVEEMFYVDAGGKVWSLTSPLATGQKAALTPATMDQLTDWCAQHGELLAVKTLGKYLTEPRNHFFASAQAAPGFTQETLPSIRWQQNEVLVHGSLPPP